MQNIYWKYDEELDNWARIEYNDIKRGDVILSYNQEQYHWSKGYMVQSVLNTETDKYGQHVLHLKYLNVEYKGRD